MNDFSRRQLEFFGEPIGNSATRNTPCGRGRILGGGGGGGGPQYSYSTVQQSNLPDYIRPQMESLLGSAMGEYFTTQDTTKQVVDAAGKQPGAAGYEPTFKQVITGITPYTPYSTRPQDYLAGFSPLQEQTFFESANMQRPGQFAAATDYTGLAGEGALRTAPGAFMYGGAGFGTGQLGQGLGVAGGARYGGAAAGLAPVAQGYGQAAAGTGAQYAGMATSPAAVQSYMSPYQRAVIDVQKEAAVRDYNIQRQARNAQAARAGAYGGSRQAIQEAEAERALATQKQNIESAGMQSAYDKAIQAMQFGTTAGLQGQQAGMQGLGQAGQLYGLGLQGVQQQLAGTAQGMQGAQLGLTGVGAGQAAYDLAGRMGGALAGIGAQQQATDIARIQQQQQLGALQQAQEQSYINQAIQNYAMAQQHPFQQLSAFSGLLRGYATPQTTTQQYQASPSTVSQLAGLGTAGLGLAAMGNMFGGAAGAPTGKRAGGKVKDDDGIDELMIRRLLKKVAA